MNTITTPKRQLSTIIPGVYHAKGRNWYAAVIDREYYYSASFTKGGNVWMRTCRTLDEAVEFVERRSKL